MSKVSILAIGAILFSSQVAFAQEPELKQAPVPETRIRAKQQSGVVWVGTLRSLSADSVVFVDPNGRQTALALQNLELERSLGRTGNFWKTFGITVASAAVVGGLISAATWDECVSTEFLGCFMVPESRSEAALYGVAAGGVLAIPVGALLGALVKTERWELLHPPGK